MSIPDITCKIDAYCSINPSEDRQKVEQAVSNILVDMEFQANKNSLKATSENHESLNRIHETIHARKTQKTYRRHLNQNLIDDSTWFYLNKQAALAKVVALCSEADESPLGPIKIILRSNNIDRLISWLVSDSQ